MGGKLKGGSHRLKRSVCPVACTLDLLGDRWTLLIIRDLMCGKSRFKQFLQSPEKIASNILAQRLQRLVAAGLVVTTPAPDRDGAAAYQLSSKGNELLPVLDSLRNWGLKHIPGSMDLLKPRV